jgi:hypothetical protein
MVAICVRCRQSFKAKRADARLCSNRCRKAVSRQLRATRSEQCLNTRAKPRSAAAERDAIKVRARIATVPEPGPLKDLLDSAWQSVKHSLLRSLSIGFMPIKSTPIASGLRITEWQWIETSLVSCPANLRCTIGAG